MNQLCIIKLLVGSFIVPLTVVFIIVPHDSCWTDHKHITFVEGASPTTTTTTNNNNTTTTNDNHTNTTTTTTTNNNNNNNETNDHNLHDMAGGFTRLALGRAGRRLEKRIIV